MDLVIVSKEVRVLTEGVLWLLLRTSVGRPRHALGCRRGVTHLIRVKLDVGAVNDALMKLRHHVPAAVHCHVPMVSEVILVDTTVSGPHQTERPRGHPLDSLCWEH